MNSARTLAALEKFSEIGIIPVVVLNDVKDAEEAAELVRTCR